MELHEALYTTRAMRRVRTDPIPFDAQARILDAAIRAPSGGNSQPWRFVLVDSAELKAELGPLYRRSIERLWATVYKDLVERVQQDPDLPANRSTSRVQRSAQWLADHYEEVPLYLFAFVRSDSGASSIFPAVWSAQLAARAEGIGSALTSILGNFFPDDVRRILAVPDDSFTNVCMVSFGYPTGRWGVAERRPVDEVAGRNSWEGELGFSVPEPLWPGVTAGGKG